MVLHGSSIAIRNKSSILLLIAVGLMTANGQASIEHLREARDKYIEHFRIKGEHQLEKAEDLIQKIKAFSKDAPEETEARAIYELATMQRITNQFVDAVKTYRSAATLAEARGQSGIAFDAWIGVARAHAFGDRDHGAAKEALNRAIRNAPDPTPKQAYEIADYRSQLLAGRGELESALVLALDAVRLAKEDADLFYAMLDVASVLQNFAERCDYRKIVDAKSSTDENDSWGACRRAVAAAKSYYQQGRMIAQKLGWSFLVGEMDGFITRLEPRLFLINQQASFEKISMSGIFTAEYVEDVIVNEDFSAGASGLTEFASLGQLIGEVVSDSDSLDPRSQYLLGLRADVEGDQKKALEHFIRADELLQRERETLFDPRGRGTVVENRPELVRDLALRFLAIGERESAFRVFESIRSRGLTTLAATFETSRFVESERKWLAELIQVLSQQSSIQNGLVETAIAGVEHSRSIEMLEDLKALEGQQRELLSKVGADGLVAQLRAAKTTAPSMSELQALVRESRTNVVFYWVTRTNVLVWAIGPRDVTIKTVFIPEVAVIDKVSSLLDSASKKEVPFDEKCARELYAYLVAPFADFFGGEQVIVVPQGPLVALPFEALVDAKTGQFLVEKSVISYAPNASMAVRALKYVDLMIVDVTAVYDEKIERVTNEISKIKKLGSPAVESVVSQEIDAEELVGLLGKRDGVHVLLHGFFDQDDPLRSHISLNNPDLTEDQNNITAGELVAVDWSKTHLAVFGSCEGARVDARISNEIHGLSWAPIVGGADNVLVSRWRVQATSNASWMQVFYENLGRDGETPASSSAKAMRQMIASGQTDPFYWSAPQLFGR